MSMDTELAGLLSAVWPRLVEVIIGDVDGAYGVHRFDKSGGHFNERLFLAWCAANGICSPLLESGAPDLKLETFRDNGAEPSGLVATAPATRHGREDAQAEASDRQ